MENCPSRRKGYIGVQDYATVRMGRPPNPGTQSVHADARIALGSRSCETARPPTRRRVNETVH